MTDIRSAPLVLLLALVPLPARAQIPDVIGQQPPASRSDERPHNHAFAAGFAGQFGLVGGSATWMLGPRPFGIGASAGLEGSGAFLTATFFDSRTGHSLLALGPSSIFFNAGVFTSWSTADHAWLQFAVGERRWVDPKQQTFIELGLDLSLPLDRSSTAGVRGWSRLLPHLAIGYTF